MENRIKAFREKYGMTQKELSEEYFINLRTIQNWEQGRSECPEWLVDMLYSDQARREYIEMQNKLLEDAQKEKDEFLDHIKNLSDEVDYWYHQMKVYEIMYRDLVQQIHGKG